MEQSNEMTNEKQRHFLKRVAEMEKKIKSFEGNLQELNRKYEILIKSLRR